MNLSAEIMCYPKAKLCGNIFKFAKFVHLRINDAKTLLIPKQ